MDWLRLPKRDQMNLWSIARNGAWPPLTAIGLQYQTRRQFSGSFNADGFSLILHGRGWFEQGGARWRIDAPAVFLHGAQEQVRYGPDGSWDELFICYAPRDREQLLTRGWWTPEQAVWRLPSTAARSWLSYARALVALLDAEPDPATAVACDQVAGLVLQHAAAVRQQVATEGPALSQDHLQRIAQRLHDQGAAWMDVPALAAECGVSVQHFRRCWRQRFGRSPDQWMAEGRLIHAKYLLCSGTMSVDRIACRVGYEDRRYFARVFKRRFGMTPRAFRQRNQAAVSAV